MRKVTVVFLSSLLGIMFFCSKSPESRGDDFLKKGNIRTAYIYYQKALKAVGDNPSEQLKDKYLSLTVKMAKDRIKDDETFESLSFYHDDFMKYASSKTSPKILQDYSIFVLAWADSIFTNYNDINGAISLLDDVKKLAPNKKIIANKKKKFKISFGKAMLKRAISTYVSAKKQKSALDMVGAEYYALVAQKFLGNNKSVARILRKTRKENLSTYSAYDRAMEDEKTDPQIDKYSIYIAVVKERKSRRRGRTIEGSIYNLSADGPIELDSKQFTLVDKKGKIHKASRHSKFQKITLDTKLESKFTLKFPTAKGGVKKLVFDDGKRRAEKYYP